MVVQKKTYTYTEYARLIDSPDNANTILELIDGEIEEKMASFTPSRIALRIGYFLSEYLDERNLGYVTGADGGYIMSDDNVFIPDVGYIAKERMPQTPAREVPTPPDLAVEVKSPTDTKRAMRQKAEKYLQFGTRLVWLVFPDEQLVEIYTPDDDVITVGMDGVLEGDPILPDFTLPVRNIFRS